MTILGVLGWIVCGLLVGLCARFLVPGRQNMTLVMTTVLGIVGALLGGYVYSLTFGSAAEPFSLTTHNWYGWIVSILGAMGVVWVYPFVFPAQRWNW